MLKVLLAMLMLAVFGASSIDPCGGHFVSGKVAGVSAQAGNPHASHQAPAGADHGSDHCCPAHCAHVAAMPAGVGFIAALVSSQLAFTRFVSYSDPSLHQNTRPPLAA